MNRLYPLTALIDGTLLLAWRVLRREPKAVQLAEEPEDYGAVVAPTG